MAHGWKINIENKKPNVVYTMKTPFIEYLEDLRRINICPEAREYYEKVYSENNNITFGEVLNNYPPNEAWSISMLQVYDGQLEKEVWNSYFKHISHDMAFYLLWKNLVNISDEERSMLRERFRGKLPNVERRL